MTLPKYPPPHPPNKGKPVHSPDELLLSEQLQLNVDDNMAYSARCHRRLQAKANTVITRGQKQLDMRLITYLGKVHSPSTPQCTDCT